MKNAVIGPLVILSSLLYASAQSAPVEVVLGHEHYWYQHIVSKTLHRSPRFGFFHVSSLHAFFRGQRQHELMSQSYVTYKLLPGVVAAVGTFYSTAPGFSPSFAVQLSKKSGDLYIVIVPRIDLKEKASYDAMSFVQYNPTLSPTLRFYSRIQAMSNFSDRRHNRGYQNFRLGIEINKFQFGAAMNVDQYGSERQTYYNIGAFLRTEL